MSAVSYFERIMSFVIWACLTAIACLLVPAMADPSPVPWWVYAAGGILGQGLFLPFLVLAVYPRLVVDPERKL